MAAGSLVTRKPAFEDPITNRSLQRGIEVLRAFRPGTDLLGNGELAERTGLSRATVSRLTQTLVGSGMLEHDLSARAYRLAPAVLSLAHAMRAGSPLLATVTPLLRAAAQTHRVNAGLAAADRDDMIYLESIRYHPRASLRTIVAGQRVPIRLTSLGRAWLAGIALGERDAIMRDYKKRFRKSWKMLGVELEDSFGSVMREGFCVATWQPGVVALGAPLILPSGRTLAINMSVSGIEDSTSVVARLATPLLRLKADIEAALQEAA